MPAFSTSVTGWKEHTTRRAQIKAPEGGFYQHVSKGVGGDAVLICGGALGCVQVRVNPCGARSVAGRSHTAVWNGRERES